MKLSELMTRQVRTCPPDAPLSECARMMADVNCGAVPITQGKELVGIITDRDIVLRAVAKGKDINNSKVSECMSKGCITASPDTDAHEAAALMARKQIRRLPIVQNGELAGIVALGDMATVNIHVNEAGEALSSISAPAEPGAHGAH